MGSQADDGRTLIFAGLPAHTPNLYRQTRFLVTDPTVLIETHAAGSSGGRERHLIVRDIEMERARAHARADRVYCPAEFTPFDGLSGDREIATAQAAAEFLVRHEIKEAWSDRSLPLVYAHFIGEAGVELRCDPSLGVVERRMKDDQEVEFLKRAQAVTERAMEMALRRVANAEARADGVLMQDGAELTSERLRGEIDVFLLGEGFANARSIAAGGPQSADCHQDGSGPLRTGEPVIIDIFPQDKRTLYNGDCTRCVVHGDVPDEVARMHAAVVAAKAEAIGATRAGVTGQAVHEAAAGVIRGHGYEMGLPGEEEPATYTGMVHGTGHGVGLEVHEPPLLDHGGPELVVGDALTIEPGLYCRAIGGIRIEDMVIVREGGCENLNTLGEGLDWRGES